MIIKIGTYGYWSNYYMSVVTAHSLVAILNMSRAEDFIGEIKRWDGNEWIHIGNIVNRDNRGNATYIGR